MRCRVAALCLCTPNKGDSHAPALHAGTTLLTAAGRTLKQLAAHHSIAVLVTNHVTSARGGPAGEGERSATAAAGVGGLKPALGEQWRPQAHMRVQLSIDDSQPGARLATLTASPVLVRERPYIVRLVCRVKSAFANICMSATRALALTAQPTVPQCGDLPVVVLPDTALHGMTVSCRHVGTNLRSTFIHRGSHEHSRSPALVPVTIAHGSPALAIALAALTLVSPRHGRHSPHVHLLAFHSSARPSLTHSYGLWLDGTPNLSGML